MEKEFQQNLRFEITHVEKHNAWKISGRFAGYINRLILSAITTLNEETLVVCSTSNHLMIYHLMKDCQVNLLLIETLQYEKENERLNITIWKGKWKIAQWTCHLLKECMMKMCYEHSYIMINYLLSLMKHYIMKMWEKKTKI